MPNASCSVRQRFARLLTLAVCALVATPSFAGSSGSITFSPVDTAAIPVLGNTMLILLAALLALLGIKTVRRRGVSPMVAGLLGSAALGLATGGAGLMEVAQADIPVTQLNNPNGETRSIPGSPVVYENASGVTLEVTEIELFCEDCEIVPAVDPPACEEGMRLDDNGQCQLAVAI